MNVSKSSVNSDFLNVDRVQPGSLCDASTHRESTSSFLCKGTSAPFFFRLRKRALEFGFDDLGIVPAGQAQTFDIFLEHIRQGYCDGLDYITSNPEARRSPESVLPDVQTILVVALSEKQIQEESSETTSAIYDDPIFTPQNSSSCQIVGYATCLDYHDVLKRRLRKLGAFIREYWQDASIRSVVDTAPLLEKDWAVAAGLGFCGLHSLVIHRKLGTRFFLGELLVSVPFSELSGVETSEEFLTELETFRRQEENLELDVKSASQKCLSCRRCVEACPTHAILGDRTLDARRCLNFWTIENRAEIPLEIAQKLGDRLFGCDLCQRVCPWNGGVFHTPGRDVQLDAIENLDDATFRRLFKKTPVFRAKLAGLQRTAKILRNSFEQSDSQ